MAKRISTSTLNASTIDILNVIRSNADYQYQQNVPVITKETDIPKVGDVLYGTPELANTFINALVNRIALVRVKGALFNNPYKRLKKGFIEYGEAIEDVFNSIAQVMTYSEEKAEARELKRYLPDVKSVFYAMNWRVMYPVSIEDEALKQAFLSIEGVQDLISKIVDQIYKAAEYDEFLLFKYILIKSITKGLVKPVGIDVSSMDNAAIAFRGYSNDFTFMHTEYNESGVLNNTPKDRQVIFMDSRFNAQYDVSVLSAAFNMDKADFMGSLYLIDNWGTFDNDRWAIIREQSDGIEEVTSAELALMADVKAVLLDEDWFQIYDNKAEFRETYVAAGIRWNYFYHTWKTVAHSPFANAVVYVDSDATVTNPDTLTAHISNKSESVEATTFTINIETEAPTLQSQAAQFVQTSALTTAGIAVQPYGAIIIPADQAGTEVTLVAKIGTDTYTATTTITAATSVDTRVSLNKG